MASSAVLKGGVIGSLALSQYSPLEGLQQKTSPFRICPLRLARSGTHACSAGRIGAHRQQLLGHRGAFAGQLNGPRRGITVCGIFGLGVPELVVIAGVAAVLFGPKQLPELGKSLGKTVKSFQQAAKEFEGEIKKSAEELKEEAQSSADEFKKEVEKKDK